MKARWANAVLGVWLPVSALLLGARGAALANNLLVGVSVFLVAFLAMGIDRFRRVNTALGAWAAVSPFFLAYEDSAIAFNDVLVGLAVVALSLWSARGRGLGAER